MRSHIVLLLLAACLTACSTFDDRELASFRQKRVTPPVYSKLVHGDALDPADVIQLTRRGVSDSQILRQIDDHGVDSLVDRADVRRMRQAGVSAVVIDGMLHSSDEFTRDHTAPRYHSAYFSGYDYYDPWPWYGGLGFGFSTGGYHHSHCW